VRLTILGGGGFRVPLVFRALRDDPALGVEELVLHDVDASRLEVVSSVLDHLAAEGGRAPAVRTTTDLSSAVREADFVFSAIRVGGLAGRICDERAALAEGVIGQETTGAGGICYGLRTVPEAMRVADVVAAEAPAAWVINFTNPAGMVTEAMRGRLGDRVVGICDSPVGLFRRVARALEVPMEQAEFDYAGLNHLGWLRAVRVEGVDRLPELLADAELLTRIEEGRLFGADWLRTLGTIPNEYLWYWYFRSDALTAELAAEETRGEQILRQQRDFYHPATWPPGEVAGGRASGSAPEARTPYVAGAGGGGPGDAAPEVRTPHDDGAAGGDPGDAAPEVRTPYEVWESTRLARESSYMADSREVTAAGERDPYDLDGGGYDRIALAVMRAVSRNEPTTLVLNVANRGTFDFLDDEAVIEVPCRIDGSGPRALPVGPLDLAAQGLVASQKAAERATIDAATSGSTALAVKALAVHPLVGSVSVARRILDRQLTAVPELAQVLTSP
jgi:6-phospho-beta-glucosidase